MKNKKLPIIKLAEELIKRNQIVTYDEGMVGLTDDSQISLNEFDTIAIALSLHNGLIQLDKESELFKSMLKSLVVNSKEKPLKFNQLKESMSILSNFFAIKALNNDLDEIKESFGVIPLTIELFFICIIFKGNKVLFWNGIDEAVASDSGSEQYNSKIEAEEEIHNKVFPYCKEKGFTDDSDFIGIKIHSEEYKYSSDMEE